MASGPADHGALADKVVHVCRRYDIACDAPRRIAVLDLALQVLGQMHFTLVDPGRTVDDFVAAVRGLVASVVLDTVRNPEWFDSDESYLDLLRRAADRTDAPGRNELSVAEFADAARWATREGAPLVREKLALEGPRFVEDNRDLADLVLQPYIFLGFVQHMLYWNNNPHDPWYWESERIVDWIADLVAEQNRR